MITEDFLKELSSSAPTPGGGGVAALLAALASALCSMVANLTTGKKKYAQYQEDIDKILNKCDEKTFLLYSYIQKDALAFEPLSKAYGIPKDDPGREEILQNALLDAASTPIELMKLLSDVCDMIEELSVKGSKLAVSDVAVAATTLRAAAEGAVMNVYINTKLMSDKDKGASLNNEAINILSDISNRCDKVYKLITEELVME